MQYLFDLILPTLLFSMSFFFFFSQSTWFGARLVLPAAEASLMHVAALHDKEPLLKAKCHQKKTEIVKRLDVDYKWVTKMQKTQMPFRNNLLDLAAVT